MSAKKKKTTSKKVTAKVSLPKKVQAPLAPVKQKVKAVKKGITTPVVSKTKALPVKKVDIKKITTPVSPAKKAVVPPKALSPIVTKKTIVKKISKKTAVSKITPKVISEKKATVPMAVKKATLVAVAKLPLSKKTPKTIVSVSKISVVKRKTRLQKPVELSGRKKRKSAPVKKSVSGPGLASLRAKASLPLTTGKGPKYFFSTEIPKQYNETYMRVLPRDPYWLFAYWEITPEVMASVKKKMGDVAFDRAKGIIRVLDVTNVDYSGDNAWRRIDINIMFNAKSAYIKIWEPGRTYLLCAGLLTDQGEFVEVVRSVPTSMPRTGISSVTDKEWQTATSDELMRISAMSLKRTIGASERLDEFSLDLGGNFTINAGSGSGSIM